MDQFAHPDLYAYLMSELGHPQDAGAVTDLAGVVRPTGTSESDDGNISSFHDDHPARSPDDPERFGATTERLDYVLGFPGALYVQHVDRARVVRSAVGSRPRHLRPLRGAGRSRHNDAAFPRGPPARRCRPDPGAVHLPADHQWSGRDEVRFTLSAKGESGQQVIQSSPEVDDVDAGTVHDFELGPIRLPDPGERLSLRVEGLELDDLSADDRSAPYAGSSTGRSSWGSGTGPGQLL